MKKNENTDKLKELVSKIQKTKANPFKAAELATEAFGAVIVHITEQDGRISKLEIQAEEESRE